MTELPELFAALARPFGDNEIKKRSQSGLQLKYVTARTVMNRLDDVLGPENWWDDYTPLENSVVCRLSIRLPDGTILTKSDAGGYAGMSDQGDDDKSGYSDAFKRAAVKIGVGRHLYGDGIPKFATAAPRSTPAAPVAAATPAVAPPAPRPEPIPPVAETKGARPARGYWQMVVDATHRRNELHGESISPADTHWMLVVMAAAKGKFSSLPRGEPLDSGNKLMDELHAREPGWVIARLTEFVSRKVTPRHVDSLYHFERANEPFPEGIPLDEFVRHETTRSGRGVEVVAMKFVTEKLMTSSEELAGRWPTDDGRRAVLDALREYLDANPCTLPPLVEGDPACAPTPSPRRPTSRA